MTITAATIPVTAPLKVDAATGLLVGARQVLSPHFDARPTNVVPERGNPRMKIGCG